MKILEIKKLVLTTKKTSKETSQAYANILKQIEAKTVGVKYDEKDEEKIVLSSIKKELKEQEQSKDAGAPYSKETLALCLTLIDELSQNVLSEDETVEVIKSFISTLEKPNVGQVMGYLKKTYGDSVDMALASKLVRELV